MGQVGGYRWGGSAHSRAGAQDAAPATLLPRTTWALGPPTGHASEGDTNSASQEQLEPMTDQEMRLGIPKEGATVEFEQI